jgi:23S rRNA pseudouridine1911/1915/1917 synthase
MNFNESFVLKETDDFAVVFKPPRMHSAPQKHNSGDTLVGWYVSKTGAGEGLSDAGLMHRLDYETHGLVLFAKNEKSFKFFQDLQDGGGFVKEYSAICKNTIKDADNPTPLPGFPRSPLETTAPALFTTEPSIEKPLVINSFFRPFGPGRKEVRPVINENKKHDEVAKDRGGLYRTEIINITGSVFTVRIKRGFRHQIRCHLRWIGCPIQGDPVYTIEARGTEVHCELALRAYALYFVDPSNGEKVEVRVEPLQ